MNEKLGLGRAAILAILGQLTIPFFLWFNFGCATVILYHQYVTRMGFYEKSV